MESIRYKGKGEHSVRELELIIEQQAEELHLIKSGQFPTNEEITSKAKKRALKFNFVNEIGYLRHKKSFELGAEFVKNYIK